MAHRPIKTITSHVGHARYLAQCEDKPAGFIPRADDVKTPYAYSPTTTIYRHSSGQLVFIAETAHKRYVVYAYEGPLMSQDGAENEYVRQSRMRSQGILQQNCKGFSA